MIELYLSKVTESSETETAGKLYARVSYKQSMDLHDMAKGKKRGYYLVDWPKMSTFARIIATLFKLYQNRKK